MTGEAFVNLIYTWLNQRWISFIVWRDALLNFINLWLTDIFSFEWRYWSFMYHDETITIDPAETATTIQHNLTYPIIRVQNIFDVKNQISQFERKNVNINLQEKEIFYRPLNTDIYLYNNTDWYKIAYIHTFIFLTDLAEQLPLPNIFLWALYDLVMAYILPIYWQAGEQKEVSAYQRWMSKLKELAKFDANPIEKVKTNIV